MALPSPAHVLTKTRALAHRPTGAPGLAPRARAPSAHRPRASATDPPPTPHALLLECDGIAVDVTDWTRRAFNAAFAELGLDCVRWTPTLFADLVRTGDGTGPGLVHTYFNTVGYPTMLATADRGAFAERVYALKRTHAAALVESGDVPLRAGVRDLVDEAMAAGARIALLGGTASDPEAGLADAAARAFGARDVSVFMVPASSCDGTDDGDDDDTTLSTGSMEQSFAAAAARVDSASKSAAAAAVVRELASSTGGGDSDATVLIDQALLAAAAGHGASAASPQWLAAVAAALGAPCAGCAVVAARAGLIAAARAAGMVAAAAPTRSGSRGTGEFPGASAVADGFGPGGGVTWRRLVGLMAREA